jgi:hypothetical protein
VDEEEAENEVGAEGNAVAGAERAWAVSVRLLSRRRHRGSNVTVALILREWE